METHSYRLGLPVPFILNIYGNGTFSESGNERGGIAVASVDESYRYDIENDLASRGWVHVGAGDQRFALTTFTQTYSTTGLTVTAVPSWSAPGIVGSYDAGVLNLLDAASNTNLNNLASKCATLEAEFVALRGRNDDLLKLLNAVTDTLQAAGLAA